MVDNPKSNQDAGNEGQRMVWHLQDLQEQIDAENIQEVQLLPGIDLASAVDEKRKTRRLFKPDENTLENKHLFQDDLDLRGVNEGFEEKRKEAQQNLFRERQVDSLIEMIYGRMGNSFEDKNNGYDSDQDDEAQAHLDSYRYDVAAEKLNMFSNPAVKRKLKTKFVTGQGQDQIVKNLLNMSDSEAEEGDGKGQIDKE